MVKYARDLSALQRNRRSSGFGWEPVRVSEVRWVRESARQRDC